MASPRDIAEAVVVGVCEGSAPPNPPNIPPNRARNCAASRAGRLTNAQPARGHKGK